MHIKYTVKGTVQGVNFRAWTQKQAQKLGTVTGWVMNTPDGHVIGEALGPEADLETLKVLLHKGPRHAQVTDLTVDETTVVDGKELGWSMEHFEIRR